MEKHGRIPLVVNAGIVIALIIISVLSYMVFDGAFSKKNFDFPTASQEIFVLVKPDGTHSKFVGDVYVTFHATALSAQNDIGVEIKIVPNSNFPVTTETWKDYPEVLHMIFPYATFSGEAPSLVTMASVDLIRHDDPMQYVANELDIVYTFGGNYGYFFLTPRDAQQYIQGNRMAMSKPVFEERLGDNTTFQIMSADVTYSIETNNIFFGLTLLVLAFSLVELRNHIIDGFSWAYENTNKVIQPLRTKLKNREENLGK